MELFSNKGGEGKSVSFEQLIFEVAKDGVFNNYVDCPIDAVGKVKFWKFFDYLESKIK